MMFEFTCVVKIKRAERLSQTLLHFVTAVHGPQKYQVYGPNTGISEQSVCKILTLFQHTPFLLSFFFWIGGRQCMVLRLCVTVELFCVPSSPYLSTHIILVAVSLSLKMYNWDYPWAKCVLADTQSTSFNWSTPFFLLSWVLILGSQIVEMGWTHSSSTELEWLGWFHSSFPELAWPSWMLSLVVRGTSITMSHWSRAGGPSIRRPASRKIISDSVELWEPAICFLHIWLNGKYVLLPKNTKTLLVSGSVLTRSCRIHWPRLVKRRISIHCPRCWERLAWEVPQEPASQTSQFGHDHRWRVGGTSRDAVLEVSSKSEKGFDRCDLVRTTILAGDVDGDFRELEDVEPGTVCRGWQHEAFSRVERRHREELREQAQVKVLVRSDGVVHCPRFMKRRCHVTFSESSCCDASEALLCVHVWCRSRCVLTGRGVQSERFRVGECPGDIQGSARTSAYQRDGPRHGSSTTWCARRQKVGGRGGRVAIVVRSSTGSRHNNGVGELLSAMELHWQPQGGGRRQRTPNSLNLEESPACCHRGWGGRTMVSRDEVVLQPACHSPCPKRATRDEEASRASLAHALGSDVCMCSCPRSDDFLVEDVAQCTRWNSLDFCTDFILRFCSQNKKELTKRARLVKPDAVVWTETPPSSRNSSECESWGWVSENVQSAKMSWLLPLMCAATRANLLRINMSYTIGSWSMFVRYFAFKWSIGKIWRWTNWVAKVVQNRQIRLVSLWCVAGHDLSAEIVSEQSKILLLHFFGKSKRHCKNSIFYWVSIMTWWIILSYG